MTSMAASNKATEVSALMSNLGKLEELKAVLGEAEYARLRERFIEQIKEKSGI